MHSYYSYFRQRDQNRWGSCASYQVHLDLLRISCMRKSLRSPGEVVVEPNLSSNSISTSTGNLTSNHREFSPECPSSAFPSVHMEERLYLSFARQWPSGNIIMHSKQTANSLLPRTLVGRLKTDGIHPPCYRPQQKWCPKSWKTSLNAAAPALRRAPPGVAAVSAQA
jgi:hypothetical protein